MNKWEASLVQWILEKLVRPKPCSTKTMVVTWGPTVNKSLYGERRP